MIEKRIGPTPSGGVYSIAYYLDKDRKPVDKADAAIVIICEFDDNDDLIFETTGIRAEKME